MIKALLIGGSALLTAFACDPPAILSPATPPQSTPTTEQRLGLRYMSEIDLLAGCMRAMKLAPIKDTTGWRQASIERYDWALARSQEDIHGQGALESVLYTDLQHQEQTPEQIEWMRYLICPRFDDLTQEPPDEPAQ